MYLRVSPKIATTQRRSVGLLMDSNIVGQIWRQQINHKADYSEFTVSE